jgi:long-chain fatty acid transport protein
MNEPSRAIAAAALAAFAAAAPARATDIDQFGFGPRPIAMGGAYTALATDWTAPFYNPAGLALGRTIGVGAAFGYTAYDLDFKSEAGGPDLDRRVARNGPLGSISFGFGTTLGAPETFLGRFGAGIAMFLPTRHALTVDWVSAPAEPQFFLYGVRQDRLQFLPALSFRVPLGAYEATERLAIGVGANSLVNLKGQQTFTLADSAASQVKTRVEANYNLAPNFGIFYWPVDWLSVGVAYRGELSLGSKIDVIIDLTGGGASDFPLDLESVSFFEPEQVQGGIALDPVDWLTLSLDITWKDWSSFHDPFLTVGEVVAQVEPHFKDTITPRFGAEAEPYPNLALRLGYYFQPTPIPRQSGATTLVDLDKHVFSVGAGYTIDTTRPTGETWRPLSLDVYFQWQHLVGERVEKDGPTGAGGVGAWYEAGGDIFSFGAGVTVRL